MRSSVHELFILSKTRTWTGMKRSDRFKMIQSGALKNNPPVTINLLRSNTRSITCHPKPLNLSGRCRGPGFLFGIVFAYLHLWDEVTSPFFVILGQGCMLPTLTMLRTRCTASGSVATKPFQVSESIDFSTSKPLVGATMLVRCQMSAVVPF